MRCSVCSLEKTGIRLATVPDESERGRGSGAPRRIRITIAVATAAPFCASDKAPTMRGSETDERQES